MYAYLDHKASDIPIPCSSVRLAFVVLLFSLLRGFLLTSSPSLFTLNVGVLAPEEFRWKISFGEDLEPLVGLVYHLHWKLFVIHRW